MAGSVSVESQLNKGTTFTIEFKTSCLARNEKQTPSKKTSNSSDLSKLNDLSFSDSNFVSDNESKKSKAAACVLSQYKVESDDSSASGRFSDKMKFLKDPQNKKPRLLVVNDSQHMLELICMSAEKDFQCDIAENGLIAFSKVKHYPRNHYAAILLDINMPIMDGFEACDLIYDHLHGTNDIKSLLSNQLGTGQNDHETSKTKIFALSGHITELMRDKIASANFTSAFDKLEVEQIQMILKCINQPEDFTQNGSSH
jgi:CheY-like chemotaxis protein